jgi:hypothetical protein
MESRRRYSICSAKPNASFSFPPKKKSQTQPQPEDGSTTEIRAPAPKEENGAHRRQAETRLQTKLSSEGLQKRLLDIWYDARTLEEEQGVNILYLAFGLFKMVRRRQVRYGALCAARPVTRAARAE